MRLRTGAATASNDNFHSAHVDICSAEAEKGTTRVADKHAKSSFPKQISQVRNSTTDGTGSSCAVVKNSSHNTKAVCVGQNQQEVSSVADCISQNAYLEYVSDCRRYILEVEPLGDGYIAVEVDAAVVLSDSKSQSHAVLDREKWKTRNFGVFSTKLLAEHSLRQLEAIGEKGLDVE